MIQLSDLWRRKRCYKMSKLTLEHQGQKIAADCTNARQALLWSQHDLRSESQYLTIHRSANHSRDIFVFGDERSGNDHVKAGFPASFGDSLARAVDLTSPHGRACSDISKRAWRARRLRCLRNIALSFASISRRTWASRNSRNALRTTAERLLGERPCDSSSNIFNVLSSIVTAIVFTTLILSIPGTYFNPCSGRRRKT
jgi:hypothetical protein